MTKLMMLKSDKSLRWQMPFNSLSPISKILIRKKCSKRSLKSLQKSLTLRKPHILSSLAF